MEPLGGTFGVQSGLSGLLYWTQRSLLALEGGGISGVVWWGDSRWVSEGLSVLVVFRGLLDFGVFEVFRVFEV